MIDKLIREAWMRDFSYEDYVALCNKQQFSAASKETYYEECGYLEYDMTEYYRREVDL
jgi:hypothetical protein